MANVYNKSYLEKFIRTSERAAIGAIPQVRVIKLLQIKDWGLYEKRAK